MLVVTVIGMQTRRVLEPAGAGQRPMISYLLMPRPKDLVKGWLPAVTYVLGVLSTGEISAQSIARALLVLAAVELLIYPARYQWNDIRGFVADQNHPAASRRGRLPGPLSKARDRVTASGMVAAAKLAITGLLIVLLPGLQLAGVLTFAVVGVFGVAILYEAVRSTSTGKSGAIPPPVRPGVVSLWVLVGAGYVVRGMVGLALAVDLSQRPTLALAAAVTLWCYGTAFVTSRWAIEAISFASARNGRLVWSARADQAREHLLALVRWLPPSIAQPDKDIRRWVPLQQHTAVSAPWNLAMIGAGASAALTGRLLSGTCSVEQGVWVAAVGALAAALAICAPDRRLMAVLMTALLFMGTMTVLQVPRPILTALPWLLLLSAYLFFSTRSLRKLHRPNVFRYALGRIGAAAGRVVVGPTTWQALQVKDSSGTESQAWATVQRSS
ncbi:hypothetical protein MKUB_33720 [Mycobacterium kubicae]|uniref:Integral membrane protein n=1 Tax=Mycobacterium kubicae TaxID=120959 RepID=A0AAX1J8L0_9MYCO|nr:hypothetical protein [Mycobacterium kubicae]MCV7095204.1 hypothetical protein [Mycobacterium kubicae]ORV95109.1 hypothetical protein AWC13_21165 [Mycobacterium kubicae]QNI14288.1 hypothetical protein GAN18_27305 [Mycobacterium kubicae]QPI37805.1 hypothetical protein I2456_26755 [Mycobacterium kubicae]GFG65882.1 hypothetical protein MKUB_33720 [Mycobacterium kubicae]